MTLPTIRAQSATLLLVLFSLSACSDPAKEQGKAALAYWENKCKTVAGEKIYRKVEGVEGILLLKVRPIAADPEWYDRNFPGAAFAKEAYGNYYIETFLGYEHSSSPTGEPVSPTSRGYITTDFNSKNPSNKPGYRYVDVIDEKDGKRYRYTGSQKVVGQKDLAAPGIINEMKNEGDRFDPNVYRWTLDKAVAAAPAPRYAVTYEDHVIPEERAMGVASTTLKVIDTQTNEVMGELTRYAIAGGFEQHTVSPPWLNAYRCPNQSVGTEAATRKFVDQILIPAERN